MQLCHLSSALVQRFVEVLWSGVDCCRTPGGLSQRYRYFLCLSIDDLFVSRVSLSQAFAEFRLRHMVQDLEL